MNRNIEFYKKNSQYYLKSLFFHAFTHILGFNLFHIQNYFHCLFTKTDINGIKRDYINSTKVVQAAKKYFNCSMIEGVELEENIESEGAHWESRILLGEYMTTKITEDQAISEITLAFLEDSGYYKVNYYTGGLMRYG